ncbi:nuclear apoptosis-inducing factor 1-like [Dendronephthya gigantea]|uniref:nuclear apoptosis-inducing factor 1-like n=1 Tax=Dendronephthya gigantea TaxID=151771 RepID=UPI00106936F4|nr:nuclear apoptosis-inducing factor 1-like [Dendronephthya gigantea]
MADVEGGRQKKRRKLNFTVTEIDTLTSRVQENLGLIQSKLTNAVTNQKKNKIWENITKEINAIGVANRTTSEIKEKWKNLTSSAKKTFADVNRQMRKTGGGPPPKEPTAAQERIIKIFEDTPLFTGLSGFETGTGGK